MGTGALGRAGGGCDGSNFAVGATTAVRRRFDCGQSFDGKSEAQSENQGADHGGYTLCQGLSCLRSSHLICNFQLPG